MLWVYNALVATPLPVHSARMYSSTSLSDNSVTPSVSSINQSLLAKASEQLYRKHQDKRALKCYTKSNNKYCYQRLTKAQFIILHIVLFFIVSSVVMVPLSYLVIVPTMIRDKIRNLDLNQATVSNMKVDNFHQNGFETTLYASLPPQFPIPLTATIAPFTLNAYLSDAANTSSHQVVQLLMPSLVFNLHKDLVLDMKNTPATWEHTDKEYLKEFLHVPLHKYL